MIRLMDRIRGSLQKGAARRLFAILSAFVLLFSAAGPAFAQNDQGIYSVSVTVPPLRPEVTPGPEEEPEETSAPEEDTETPEETPGEEDPDETPDEEENGAEESGEETEPEPVPEIIYEAGTLTAETEGCGIRIDYPAEACIPEGAVLAVEAARGADLYAALKSASKLFRNEEDETWKRQVAEEGNRFWLVTLADAEGTPILPETGVTLTCGEPGNPEGTVLILAGENARTLSAEAGALTVSDYRLEPFGYVIVETVQIGTVTQEYSAADYTVTASYGPEAGFPADTEMKVREIRPGTPEYAQYSGMTEEALSEEWKEITLERFFDITFVSGSRELEPQADVDVQIIFKDVIELTEDHDVQAVHIENNEAKVIESETDSNESAAKGNSEAIDTVSFSSDSFSVFGVVQRKKITQKVLAADGNTYEINVTYGPEAGIPENAELLVEEIPEGSDLWEAYRKQTAAALGADDVRLPGLYDISILADGQKIEPQTPVNVSIRLANAESGEELHVVHFTEEIPDTLVGSADDQDETQALTAEERISSEKITDAVVEGNTVTFDTDGFSVYAFAYTVIVYYRTASGDNYRITLDYDADAGIPAGAELRVTEVLPGDERYAEYLEKAIRTVLGAEDEETVTIEDGQYARFFDIEILSGGQKIEPAGKVSVTFELADAPEDRQDELKVVHFTGENVDIIDADISAAAGILFETDAFSVYGVLTYPAEQPAAENLEGRTFTINHNGQYLRANILYGGSADRFERTGNSWDATVWTFESTGQAGVYNIYTTDDQGNKIYMHLDRRDPNRAHAKLGSEPQAFTVTQGSNGRYVFSANSNGTTYYLNDFNGENGFAGWYQHDAGFDEMNLEFRDPVMQDGKEYMVLVKYDGKYYIVNNDASLTEVDYDPDTKKVRVDNPMLWTVKGNGSNRHISYKSEAVGYDWTQQPSDYYLCYLNAGEEEALTEENADNVGLDNTSDPHHVTNRQYIEYITALNYSGNHLYNGSNYLGVALEDGVPVRLTGGQTGDNAAEFFFADATDVLPPDHYNHTVDHIDISISSASRVSVPLAYGTYYYRDPDSGEYQAYVVSTNTTLSLNTPVVIDSDDMKNASIKAYDKDHNEVNDAFVINGFSSNAEVEEGSAQVRINGSFKVADLDPFNYWQENDPQTRATRMDNAITYVVSVVKNLTFDMQDETHGQLYELVDGEYVPLTINTDVDMTASFSYFDPDNKCPPLQSTGPYGSQGNYDYWRSGGIPAGSGMDFTLGGDAGNDSPNVVAIEVMKLVVDEDGEIIHPAKKITYKMEIHAKAGANEDPAVANSVAQTNVGSYNGDTVSYDGYKLLHSKNITVGTDGTGLIYDYAVVPGMVYVSEDKAALTEPFEDTVGNVWEYKETVITTEYIHRGNEYDPVDVLHYSKTYTPDDPVYAAIPEVLGYFTKENGQTKKSGFIEFYVNNVYINTSVTSLEAEKQWAEGTTIPEDAAVTMDLYYAKRQISENGTPLENVADWPDYEEYLPAAGDPIFTGRGETSIVLTAADSWQGAFTELPKTWKDSDDNDWELDYYAKESAVMLDEENIIDRYSQETVKEEAAAADADRVDGKVTVTNTADKTSLTVKKEWDPEGEDSHYEEDSITLRLVRYKKDAPLRPGTLNITHIASGLPGTELPDGFEVVYTYEGENGSGSFTSAGEYTVLEGTYTVTATVTSGAAPSGYIYTYTTDPVTVTVPANRSAEAAFTSYYSRKTGTLDITHVSSGISGTTELPDGFEVTYSYTGPDGTGSFTSAGARTVPAGTYTISANVTESAAPAGYEYDSTSGQVQVTVPENGTGTAEFTSTYIPDSGVLTIRKAGLPGGASGFAATYTVTGPNGFSRTISYSQFSGNEYTLNGLKAGTYTVTEQVTGEIEGYTRTSPAESSQQAAVANNTTRTVTFTGEYEQNAPVEYATVMVRVTYHLERDVHESNVNLKLTVPKNSTVYFSCTRFTYTDYMASPQIQLQYFDDSNQYNHQWVNVGEPFNAPVTDRPITIGDQDEYCITVKQNEWDAWRATISLSTSPSGNARNTFLKALRFRASAGAASGEFRAAGLPDDYGLDTEFEGIEVTLTAADSWEQLVENLDIYDENGAPYYYAVEETDVPGYTVTYSPKYVNAEQAEGTTLTAVNTLIEANETEHDSVTVYKTDGTNPLPGATFTLRDASGEKTRVYEMEGVTSFVIDTEDPELADFLPEPGETAELTLEETAAPENHWKTDTEYAVTISASQESDWNADHTAWTTVTTYAISIDGEDSVTVANDPIRSIKVIKNVTENGEESDVLDGQTVRIGLFPGEEAPTGETPAEEGHIAELEISGSTSGEVELFTGLAAGTYWVYEVDADGYPVMDGSVTTIDGNTCTVIQPAANATVMNAGDTVTITITNNREGTGSLTVTKIIAGQDADYDKEFEFIVTQTSEPQIPDGTYGGMIFESGQAKFTLGDGASCTAVDLPYGFTYTVTETEANTEDYVTVVAYETSLEDQAEADRFIKTGETETVTVTNTKTTLKSIRVTKEWMGVVPEDTINCPAVTFALYQAEHNGWGGAEIYSDDTGFDYSSIRLDYQNNWTWNCPVELPETNEHGREYRYFVIETPVNATHNGTGDVIRTIPLIDDYPIRINGYQCRQVVDTGNWSETAHYQQPFNAHIGNHGEIKIQNKAPGYLQMSIKKKFWTVDSDGSTWTTTTQMKGIFLELQLYRRAVEDKPSDYEPPVVDWAEYGSSFIVGYEENGTPRFRNSNPFTIENQGNDWNWRIWDTDQNQGLPSHGFVRNADDSLTVVRYQYIVKELNAWKDVNGTVPYSDYTWTAILPAAWEKQDFDGNNPTLVELFPRAHLSGLDELANIASTELSVEKQWDRRTSVKEVYVKVYRIASNQNYDPNQVEDFTQTLGTGGHVLDGFSGASNSGTLSNPSALKQIDGLGYVLALKDGDNVRISDILTMNETGQSQYSYWVEEVGYADRTGTVLTDVDQFDPQYSTTGHEVTLNNVNGRIKSPVITLGSIGSNKFTVSNTSTDPTETEIRVRKTDMEGEFLAGAAFKVVRVKNASGAAYAQDEEGAWQSGEQAVETAEGTVFDGLEAGFYRLVETTVPPGYLPLSEKIIFEVSEQNSELVVTDRSAADEKHTFTVEDGEFVFTVKNKAGLPLPTTGGSGTLAYTLGGMALILLAGMLLLIRKRKNRAG